jgi:2'-5' RNA ligase
MEKLSEYSVWIVPPKDVYDRLAQLIARLSARHAAPLFEPHVTLLGSSTVSKDAALSRVSELAGLLKPFQVRLTEISYRDEYFRALFIGVEQTKEVMKANAKARSLFNLPPDVGYMPHLSLLYGDFPPDVKQDIMAEVGTNCGLAFEAHSIHLVLASSGIPPETWRRIEEFPLG